MKTGRATYLGYVTRGRRLLAKKEKNMFGCCNRLFSSSCGCNRCGNGCGATPPPLPSPFPPVTPPVTPQLRGMQLSLVGSSAEIVESASPVAFDALNFNNTLGISYLPGSGKITVGRTGTYLVNWWVAIENAQSAETVAFALSLNGSDVATSYSDTGGGQIYGTAIVSVGSIPATLTLVNRSGDAVTLATAAGQGSLSLTQLA